MSALIPNELSNFASFNYIWTLAVLTREEVNSGSYLGREPQYILAKTGGYTKSSEITTAEEDRLGINVEYFVDEVEINSIYAPNPRSGITSAVKIDFKVQEPYSVGLFFQTLAIASSNLGHGSSYASLPCLLRCEFLGYNSDGTVVQKIVRDIAISLINMTFSVEAGGATYLVEAIPWNQLALGDIAQKTRSDIQIGGFTVEEIVATGPNSLVRYLNEYEDRIRVENNKQFANEYIIEFPDSLGSYTATATTTGLDAGAFSVSDGVDNSLAMAANAAAGRVVVSTSPVSSIARIGLNSIGASRIRPDFNSMGNQAHGLDVVVYDPNTETWNNSLLSIDSTGNFSFRQGVRIVEVIEQVILTSEWARSIMDRLAAASNGKVDWFRVETVVNTLEDGQKMQYVYKVIPYQVDRSIFEVRSQVRDYTQTIPNVKKGYNYIYTGRNTDILNFDININFAFFQNILPDSGLGANNIFPDLSAALSQLGLPIVSAANALGGVVGAVSNIVNAVGNIASTFTGNATGTGVSPTMTTSNPLPNGAGIDDAKIRIANEFHNTLLNSDIELIAIDLEVWGDPYFLPDSGMGNHITDRGMDYQNGEVDIAFNFNTPIDLKYGVLQMASGENFLGLYKIVKVTHTFNKGEFKQILNMIRRPGQDTATRNAVRAMLIEYQTGVSVPTEMFINSSENQRTSFIYNQILGSTTALNSILSKVLAFQNISNILPLPQDLLNLFGTISNFGNTIMGITNSVNQVFETFNSAAAQVTSAVSGIQSSFRNTVDSFNRLF